MNGSSLLSKSEQVNLGLRRVSLNFDRINIAVATTVRTGTFLWARSARPQKCPKRNGSIYRISGLLPWSMNLEVVRRLNAGPLSLKGCGISSRGGSGISPD
jgi:hypothetical protein